MEATMTASQVYVAIFVLLFSARISRLHSLNFYQIVCIVLQRAFCRDNANEGFIFSVKVASP